MAWRNWNVVLVLILANYLVFSFLAAWVFPAAPVTAPTHIPKPTFTRSIIQPRNVGTLSYDFLTPTATATFVSTQTITATRTATATAQIATPTSPPD